MSEDPKHTVLVSLPVAHYASLARMVANRILRNPTDQTRVATICREIICEHLDELACGAETAQNYAQGRESCNGKD